MNKEQLLGIIRHVLTAAGAVLVFKGYIDEGTVMMVIGAVSASIGGIWSLFDKTDAQTAVKVEAFQAKQEEITK